MVDDRRDAEDVLHERGEELGRGNVLRNVTRLVGVNPVVGPID